MRRAWLIRGLAVVLLWALLAAWAASYLRHVYFGYDGGRIPWAVLVEDGRICLDLYRPTAITLGWNYDVMAPSNSLVGLMTVPWSGNTAWRFMGFVVVRGPKVFLIGIPFWFLSCGVAIGLAAVLGPWFRRGRTGRAGAFPVD